MGWYSCTMMRMRTVGLLATGLFLGACSKGEPAKPAVVPKTEVAPSAVSPEPSPSGATSSLPPSEELSPNHVRSQADCPEGMIFIPGGKLHYRGRPFDSESDEPVTRDYDVKPFCIDREEVDSLAFSTLAPEVRRPAGCSGKGSAESCVTREDAETYCARISGSARLPSPEEFVFAAVGESGRRFPWGDTFYPWGDDPSQGRPPKSRFCDWEVNEGQLTKERQIFFAPKGCSIGLPTDDVSVFGVANLGSNVLEWTSGTYRENSGIVRCTVMGLDFSRRGPMGFPPGTDMVARVSARCEPNLSRDQRASDLVGFRCATSLKSDQVPTPPPSATP